VTYGPCWRERPGGGQGSNRRDDTRSHPLATILIVDTRSAGRQPLISLLGRHGHRVLEAANGERAREIARAENPDLVLTDVPLPDMDGRQLVLDADAMPQTVVRERARGVQYFVRQPGAPDTLISAIDAALAALPSRSVERDPVQETAGAALLRAPASRLRRRLADLEDFNHDLTKRLEDAREQLEIARSALQEEVTKRIWAETELTRANLQLRDRAVRDALTGVHNRGYLEESLAREESRARRSGQPLGVLMIDIDHFKRCNDTHGHAAGDVVLRGVGQYVLSLTRSEDIFCRYGGEEFVLIMIDTTARAAWERAEALRAGVQELRFEHEGRVLGPVTLSIGVAMIPDHAPDGQAGLRAADAALYRAKKEGRNRVMMADAEPAVTAS
jgi:diguanylate cyclase (GGDEF)-like protein